MLPRARLELDARPDAEGPRPPGHDQGSSATAAIDPARQLIGAVEQVRDKGFDIPFRPVQTRENVDHGRGAYPPEIIVRIDQNERPRLQRLRPQRGPGRALVGNAALDVRLDVGECAL